MKVSVVVPVFNAGDYLDRCAPSLLKQSIGPDAYEVIYVNDGSTDDSEQRLARIIAQHQHARYLTQPNSGWPGKPRNVGIAASTAEYIQFVDQDDELAPQALERLYAMGSRNRADIVIGKLGGSMARPNPVFRRSVEQGSLADVPAIESLTGHKMFRRAFLEEHQIRFPEGYWRMEDLLFVVRAYVHDPRISVVADYTCYLWHARADAGNISVAPFDIHDHYRRLRVIIETVRDGTPPGPLQDQLLVRLYRLETLSRVTERYIFDPTRTDWYEAFEPLRAVAVECFPPSVRRSLPAIPQLRGALVEAGEQQGTYELARRIAALRPIIARRKLRIGADGVFRVQLTFSLAFADQRPLSLVADGSSWVLDPELTEGLPGQHPFPVEDPLREAQAQLQLEDLDRGEWWYPEGELTVSLVERGEDRRQVIAAGEFSIDPARAADGHPLPPGRYAIWFSGQLLGINRRRRLVMPTAARQNPSPWTDSTSAPVAVRLDWSGEGSRLHLEVRDREQSPVETLEAEPDAPASRSKLQALADRLRRRTR